MRPQTDIEVILGSALGRKISFWLFLLSIVMDADMLFTPILIRWGFIQPAVWTHGTHLLVGSIEVTGMGGATLLWLLMLCACTSDPKRPMSLKLIWGLAFLFTTWFGAQWFYLFSFRPSVNRGVQPV